MKSPIIVKGFSKVGEIVYDDPADSSFIVEFERIKVLVDKKTHCIVLSPECVKIQS